MEEKEFVYVVQHIQERTNRFLLSFVIIKKYSKMVYEC